MELDEVLRAYEVTRLPRDGSLHLVWARVEVDDEDGAPIVLLDAYRVSRVPHTVAS